MIQTYSPQGPVALHTRIDLAIDSPRLARHDSITLIACDAVGSLEKLLTLPGILDAGTNTCPRASSYSGLMMNRSFSYSRALPKRRTRRSARLQFGRGVWASAVEDALRDHSSVFGLVGIACSGERALGLTSRTSAALMKQARLWVKRRQG